MAREMLQRDADDSVTASSVWIDQFSGWSANMIRAYAIPLLVISWFCFWGLLLIPMLHPTWQLQKTAIAVAVGLSVLCGSMIASHHYADQAPLAVIVVDGVAMHAGNGDTFAELPSAELMQGTAVTVLQQRGNWLQIRSPDGSEGWIHSDTLEVV
jgi:hypothetical protein